MGSVAWRLSGVVAAGPDEVYAWMTDFREDDHERPAFRRGSGAKPGGRPSSRKVLSRDGDVLRIEDSWGRNRFVATVTLDPKARAVRIEGKMGYESTWRAEPDGAGTRVEVEGRMGRGVVGSLMAVFASGIRREMEQDFRGHLEDLRESVGGEGPYARTRHGPSPP